IRAFGAELVAEGDRSDAALRAKQDGESFFFSHVYHPAFRGGTMQSGLEVLQHPDSKEATRWIVPVGNGSLLLGLLAALRVHNRTDIEVIAVQASVCAGLLRPGQSSPSRATGIAIADPPRRNEMLRELEAQGGHIQEATEDELLAAEQRLAQIGILAEPASAACEVVVQRLADAGGKRPSVAWLTGSGDRV
ncbi:MAG: pyridoxal-phosphate dependent enzyme, partial [Candidatus Eisenbacteria bacterium]|nr:pyridoxal-phosphate dependent enzyme [Candidatus Eisenbacteria bacterium]